MFDLIAVIKIAGYFGLFGIVFAESGLLVGFFLPGDSLLFTAGFLASQGILNIWLLIFLLFIAAVLGDSTGYALGKKVGPKIFTKQDSLFFHKDHLKRAEQFFQRHGGKAIILARFLPVVRTFAPIVAGVGKMNYRTFLAYNVVGGALWTIGLSLMGYYLGKTIPNVDRYLLPIIVGIIVLSLLPTLFHLLKDKSQRDQIRASVQSIFKRN
jgi:membrane-associated protein